VPGLGRVLAGCACAVGLATPGLAWAAPAGVAPEAVPGEFLVRAAGAGRAGLEARPGVDVLADLGDGTFLVRSTPGPDRVAALVADPVITSAEPNYLLTIDVLPTDPGFVIQWGLENSGQTGGTPDADLDLGAA